MDAGSFVIALLTAAGAAAGPAPGALPDDGGPAARCIAAPRDDGVTGARGSARSDAEVLADRRAGAGSGLDAGSAALVEEAALALAELVAGSDDPAARRLAAALAAAGFEAGAGTGSLLEETQQTTAARSDRGGLAEDAVAREGGLGADESGAGRRGEDPLGGDGQDRLAEGRLGNDQLGDDALDQDLPADEQLTDQRAQDRSADDRFDDDPLDRDAPAEEQLADPRDQDQRADEGRAEQDTLDGGRLGQDLLGDRLGDRLDDGQLRDDQLRDDQLRDDQLADDQLADERAGGASVCAGSGPDQDTAAASTDRRTDLDGVLARSRDERGAEREPDPADIGAALERGERAAR